MSMRAIASCMQHSGILHAAFGQTVHGPEPILQAMRTEPRDTRESANLPQSVNRFFAFKMHHAEAINREHTQV
jgi:hypothetical protein